VDPGLRRDDSRKLIGYAKSDGPAACGLV
jgi:hypothetical protein